MASTSNLSVGLSGVFDPWVPFSDITINLDKPEVRRREEKRREEKRREEKRREAKTIGF